MAGTSAGSTVGSAGKGTSGATGGTVSGNGGATGGIASGGRGGNQATGGSAGSGAGKAGAGMGGAGNAGTSAGGAMGGQSGAATSGGGTTGGQGGAATSGAGGKGGGSRATFRNPLNTTEGSDPWLLYHEGNYYLAATTWSNVLTMRRAATINALKSADDVVVWTGDDPSRCCNFWAPEFHLLDGPNGRRWYLYYTAGPEGTDTGNQRMHVLESAGTDPMGPYTYKARIYDSAADSWAIDASVFLLKDSLYYLFSAWEGDNQNVYIAALSNPWTMSGRRSRLSSPTLAWERQLANVNEGPVALQHDGRTFVLYSASACWGPDYKLGMLAYDGSGDPLSASSWEKSQQPVFERSDEDSVYGPAHNGFFRSPDGTEDWIVYHANSTAAGVCDTRRTTRAQPFSWNQDGTPNFGSPVPTSLELPVPAGE